MSLRVFGIACLALAAAIVGAGLAGFWNVVTGSVLAVPLASGGIILLIIGSIHATFDLDAARVRELAARGIARQGRVLDALPYASPDGGAVFQGDGAQMVLRVELEVAGGGTRQVSIHVVEPSELARARIGSIVTVLEHPEDPALRALSGFLPNGRRAR